MKRYFAPIVVGALLFGACDSFAPADNGAVESAVGPTQSAIPPRTDPNPGQAEVEFFEVCKVYSGTVGPAVTIDVVVDIGDNGSTDTNFSVQLADGECREIWLKDPNSSADLVTVTEQVPSGYAVSNVKTTVTRPSGEDVFVTDPSVASNTASGVVGSGVRLSGVLVVFTNTFIETGEGIEGCTPGYWKNHEEAWSATGYATTDDFDTVFGTDNYDPDMTLLEAARKGGGKAYALGRHGVAALLSAAHTGVDYPYTAAEVRALVQAGDKDALEEANEQGCPL